MKKGIKRIGLSLLGIIVVIAVIGAVLFWNELRTLSSLKKVDDYGMLFLMTCSTKTGNVHTSPSLAVAVNSVSSTESSIRATPAHRME